MRVLVPLKRRIGPQNVRRVRQRAFDDYAVRDRFQRPRGSKMSTTRELRMYVIRRRGGWRSPEDLQVAAGRSAEVGDNQMSADIRWIRSYVVTEADGSIGTVCIYQASSPEKIREHASRAGLPADEIIEVVDTVVVRPDPVPLAA